MHFVKVTLRMTRTIAKKHCEKCHRSLKGEIHLFKIQAPEKKGRIKWLCHKCAPIPCRYEATKPREVSNWAEFYELQRQFFWDVNTALEVREETGRLLYDQRLRLEANRQVIEEIDRRIREIRGH